MMELTIDGAVYQFRFGMGFLREANKTAKIPVQGMPGTTKEVGARYLIARVVIDQDVGFRVDLRNARDHGLDIQVIGVSCRERSSAKGRGQRHALHKTSRKSGLHGQNYDIRDGIKKSALL